MNEIGSVLCNACGLFLKLHGHARPISLKTDVIKSRNCVKSSGVGESPKKKASELQMHLTHAGQGRTSKYWRQGRSRARAPGATAVGLPPLTSLSAEPTGGDKLRDGETRDKKGQGEVVAHNED
jgi:hypothetical protein